MFEAFELEMHRYVTIVPILVGRICTRDTSVDGYDIPKGAFVSNILCERKGGGGGREGLDHYSN